MTARWRHDWLVRPTAREGTSALLVVILAVGVGYAAVRDSGTDPVSADDRSEAVATATAQVVTLATLDIRRLDVQISALRARASSGYRDDFESVMDDFAAPVEDARIKSKDSHAEAGLVSVGADAAKVLVVADARSRDGDTGEKSNATYSFLVSVTRVDEQWFVSDMEQLS